MPITRAWTNDEDPKTQMDAAVHWSLYEGACSSLIPNYETITTEEQKKHAFALARIESHYFKNEVFSAEKSLFHNIKSLHSIPTTIIQGRYDVICPIKTANKLHQLWPVAGLYRCAGCRTFGIGCCFALSVD